MTKEEYFDAGLYAYDNKNYDKAIYCFNKLIYKFSSSFNKTELSDIYYKIGICYSQSFNISEALNNFDKAEKLGFDKSKIYCGVGIAHAHNGENDKAISNFNKAIKLNNIYEEAYCRKGISYIFKLKFNKAISNFNKAIELNKNYAKAYYYRGSAFLQKMKYDKALEDFNKTIELDNKFMPVYNDRGLIYFNKNEYDKALEDFNKTIELDIKFKLSLVYNNRGLIYFNKNEYDKALEDFNKTIELDVEFILSLAYNNRGLVYLNNNEYDKALEDFNKATELDNKFTLAYINRGIVYYYRENYTKALNDFNRAIKLDDKSALAYYYIGLIYFNKNEYDKALENFNEAIKLNNEFTPTYNHIGLIYILKGKKDKAFSSFKKFEPNDTLNYIIKLFLKKDISDIENLPLKYADRYFDSVMKNVISKSKKNFFKIWCYQYALLDLLSIKNYSCIEEFSHYREKNVFEKLINSEENCNAFLRLTSISKANDPQEGEILKNLLSVNTGKNMNMKEIDKDCLVLQTSFIKYTNSLTMFRLYGKESEKEGTGICFVFNKSFFDTEVFSTASPAQPLGNIISYEEDYKENNIRKLTFENSKELQLIYSKLSPAIKPKDKSLPLYFVLYYDNEKNELIYNPTDSVYKNEVINLKNLFNENIKYDNENLNITDNIKYILKKIFIILKGLESEELKIAYKLLINIRYLIKHSAFFEEQELRLIQLTKNNYGKVLFDENINRLYLNYEIPIFEKDYLKKIIIGPKVKESSTLKETYQYIMSKKNENIEIEISDLPLN